MYASLDRPVLLFLSSPTFLSQRGTFLNRLGMLLAVGELPFSSSTFLLLLNNCVLQVWSSPLGMLPGRLPTFTRN